MTGSTPSIFKGMPGGAGIEVAPKSLDAFGGEIMDAYTTDGVEATKQVPDIRSVVSSSGLSDGTLFGQKHWTSGQDVQKLTEDLNLAVNTFMFAAQAIAVNYVVDDDAAKDQMSDVESVFAVKPGSKGSLSALMAQSQEQNAGRQQKNGEAIENNADNLVLPNPTDTSPDNTTTPTGSNYSQETTDASNAVQQHQKVETSDEDGNTPQNDEHAYQTPNEQAEQTTVLAPGEDYGVNPTF